MCEANWLRADSQTGSRTLRSAPGHGPHSHPRRTSPPSNWFPSLTLVRRGPHDTGPIGLTVCVTKHGTGTGNNRDQGTSTTEGLGRTDSHAASRGQCSWTWHARTPDAHAQHASCKQHMVRAPCRGAGRAGPEKRGHMQATYSCSREESP